MDKYFSLLNSADAFMVSSLYVCEDIWFLNHLLKHGNWLSGHSHAGWIVVEDTYLEERGGPRVRPATMELHAGECLSTHRHLIHNSICCTLALALTLLAKLDTKVKFEHGNLHACRNFETFPALKLYNRTAYFRLCIYYRLSLTVYL